MLNAPLKSREALLTPPVLVTYKVIFQDASGLFPAGAVQIIVHKPWLSVKREQKGKSLTFMASEESTLTRSQRLKHKAAKSFTYLTFF